MTSKDVFKLLLIGMFILALDMVSKGLVHSYFKPFEESPHFFPFGGISIFQKGGIDFCIHHVTNRGIAWGMGSSLQNWILMARIAIILCLGFYLCFSPKAVSQKYSLILIVTGGLGNILDYFVYGHVVDMFHFIFWGYSYPVFNVADISIFFGIVSMLWSGWKKSRQQNALSKS